MKQKWQKSRAGTRQTRGKKYLVWFGEILSQIIKDYFYLPFFPLIILWICLFKHPLTPTEGRATTQLIMVRPACLLHPVLEFLNNPEGLGTE